MIGILPTEVPFVRGIADGAADGFEARVRTACAEWIWDHYGDPESGANYFQWKHSAHRVPFEELIKALSYDEIVHVWFHQRIQSEICRRFEDDVTIEHVIYKAHNTLWKYGGHSYARFIACLAGLRRLRVDLPDFELRLSYTKWINTCGSAVHGRNQKRWIYLDAPFGVLLYYRGKHVMTISFAVGRCGVYIAQVQLREKRGNRFLYKLPKPYLDFAIDTIGAAFPDERLWLVTGTSTVQAIKSAYGEDADKLSQEVCDRVEQFYGQELRDYVRVVGIAEMGTSDDWREFVELRRRAEGNEPPGRDAIGHENQRLVLFDGHGGTATRQDRIST